MRRLAPGAGRGRALEPSVGRAGSRVQRRPLPTLRDEWRHVEERAELAGPSQTWEYQSVWWAHFGRARRGRVYVVYGERGRPIGIVPLFIQERAYRFGSARVLCNVGNGSSEPVGPLDAICAKGHEAELARAVAPALLRDTSWDFAEWSAVPEEGALSRIARELSVFERVESRVEARHGPRRLMLPPSFESFLSSLRSASRRETLELRTRFRERERTSWRILGRDIDASSALRLVEELAVPRARRGRLASLSRGAAVDAFRRELYARLRHRALIDGQILFIEGQPVAALFGMLGGRVWQAEPLVVSTRVDRKAVGRYATVVAVERAIRAGATELHVPPGSEQWDFDGMEDRPPALAIEVLRPGWRARIARLRAGMSESPAHVLRFLLGRERYEEIQDAWRDACDTVLPR